MSTKFYCDLAEARGAGWEAMDLYGLIVIGIILIVWLHMMVALRSGWWGKVTRDQGFLTYMISVSAPLQ